MTAITVGGGYVGLVSSACFARLGHHVYCLEIDAPRLRALREHHLPIREPG
jgi:UDPglucose 6-dehydrogenase